MKVWITKFALTKGIFAKEGEVCTDISAKMFACNDEWHSTFHKPDWHATEAEAKDKADSMRKRKIAGLKKKIAELEVLKF